MKKSAPKVDMHDKMLAASVAACSDILKAIGSGFTGQTDFQRKPGIGML
jgi:hypothetical protein